MEKYREIERNGKYHKYYRLNEEESCKDVINGLDSASIVSASVIEDVDRDMRNVSGGYSMDSLKTDYDFISTFASTEGDLTISILMEQDGERVYVGLFPRENEVAISTKNQNLELNSLIKKNENEITR